MAGQERLSGRELDVLARMAAGATDPEIADELGLSVHTVKTHARHIYRKLGVKSRHQAAERWQAHKSFFE